MNFIIRCISLYFAFTVTVQATIIAGTQVTLNSVTHNTFVDSITGYSWLNLANTYNLTRNEQQSLITGTNYSFATAAEISSLLDPLMDGNVSNWHTLIGDIIEGDSSATTVRFGRVAATGSSQVTQAGPLTMDSFAVNDDIFNPVVGMWAINDGSNHIPNPPTILLMLLGVIALLYKGQSYKRY